MTFSDGCPCGRSQFLTFESTDTIAVDRKTLKRVFSLLRCSVDELANARHREIFLDCLDSHLVETAFLDNSGCFQASLLLDAYYEYVPASLAQLGRNLQEAFELIRGFNHD